ncbi:MAG: rod shape-determining protein [Clostridia bacterium]|nr:rod shape-determining protein [Clostridia bacterium]
MSTFYIGLKLGSTTTCIYKAGNGIVLKEPSLIAMPTNPKIKDVKAIGINAKRMIGKVSDNIRVYSPISNGVIQYDELAIYMLKGFLKKIFTTKSIGQNIKAILCVPLGLSPQEKKQFEVTCFKAGIAEVFIVPDIMCFAIGNGINLQNEEANLIVNIGGDTTNIAVVSNFSIVKGFNLAIGGSIINTAIAKYIEETYNIKISNEQAELVKLETCSLLENYSASIEIMGLNTITQIKENITISSSELYPIVHHYYSKIAESILSILQSCDPGIVTDISKNGIYYYGNATSIIGFEKFITKNTSFKANIAENNRSNILGTGELIKYPQLLKKILKNC